MTITQQTLRARTAARIRAARPDLAARHELTTVENLLAAQEEAVADTSDDTLVAVVLHRLHLPDWIRDTCAFALSLSPEQAAAWRRSFTRTVFLAGHPARLRDRFPFRHVSGDLSAAWTAPGPAGETATLRRLLKTLHAPAPLRHQPDVTVRVPGPGNGDSGPQRHRDLYLAIADHTVPDVLVHLNHLLAEAVMDGLLTGGDHVTLRLMPRIGGLPALPTAVRAVPDHPRQGRLRAAAALS